MARPRRTDAPDLARPVNLTLGAIERLSCPPGKTQGFLRDAAGNGLRVRVTRAGTKAFVFEQSLNNRTIRRTLGSVSAHSIEAARAWAKQQAVLIDRGTDPRQLEREEVAARAAAEEAATALQKAEAQRAAADAVTVAQAWARYTNERRPRWGDRTFSDHQKMVQEGGQDRKRMPGVKTKPGPLAPLMALRLIDLTPAAVESWATKEAQERPARVRLALRLLKAFLRWADAEPDLKGRSDPSAASARKAREAAGRAKAKDDYLQRDQLKAWFKAVLGIQNPIIGAYLQALLLTGARREELATLRWDDVDFTWKRLTIRDKIEGERQIPLTPYVAHLLCGLPRRNSWVFSSAKVLNQSERAVARRSRYHARAGSEAPMGAESAGSASGRMVEPAIAHRRACAVAGLDGLTLHGLRRSFASLTEWLEVPVGVVAQIQGHKPSATAEKHYRRRPLDLLRVHHEKIEAWVLMQAGVEFFAAGSEVHSETEV